MCGGSKKEREHYIYGNEVGQVRDASVQKHRCLVRQS